MNVCLTSCRSCCKFKAKDGYFAPKITDKEIEVLRKKGLFKDVFVPFKDAKDVFQIKLVESRLSKGMLVCPYLDEQSHKCGMQGSKPFDCAFWPFMVMRDKKSGNTVVAHYESDVCEKTCAMDKAAFSAYLKKNLDSWIKKGLVKLVREYPALVWEYEKWTVVVKELGPSE